MPPRTVVPAMTGTHEGLDDEAHLMPKISSSKAGKTKFAVT